MRITMLSNFGPETRGVSPYADALYEALERIPELNFDRVDFDQAYPSRLVPAASGNTHSPGPQEAPRIVHWAKPASWRRASRLAGDVLHIQYWTIFTAYYLLSVVKHAQAQGKRVVITVHNPSPHESIALLRHWERKLLSSADALITHTARTRDALANRLINVDANHIHVIPHGVARQVASRPSSSPYEIADLDPDRRYLLNFGNLRGYKGIPILLSAWREVMAEFPDIDLIIAGRLWSRGTGPSALVSRMLGANKVESQVRTLLSDPALAARVVFREGFFKMSMIDAMCQVAALAVFTHERMAGQSGAVSHAAGFGVPVLVSDVGGLPELAMNERFVVPPGDINALAMKLRELLATDLRSLRAAQREHIDQFAWTIVAEQHAKLYHEFA